MIAVWNDMSGKNRIGFVLSGVLVLLFLGLASIWLMQEKYAILFSDLEHADAAGIVKELEKQKIDYRLKAGGSDILVPEELVHQTRLQLMGSGAPLSGGVGYEIFDSSDFGMTEFAQKINYQRALQGELTRTITSINEVKRARVHLVMADRGLFKRESSGPSASVTLFLRPGAVLNETQILGIQRLIASGVPDLKTAQVTISDQNGVTLNRAVPDDMSVEAVSLRLQQKKAVEEYLSEKVAHVLSKALGDQMATVSVDADLDFSHVKKTQEDVLPSGKVNSAGVLRRRESKLGKGPMTKTDGNRLTTEVEYQLGRSVAQIVQTPGQITRLSVAVVVPNTLSEQEQTDIRKLVSVAVGFDAKRGDAIAVYPVGPNVPVTNQADLEHAIPEFNSPNDPPVVYKKSVRQQSFPWLDQFMGLLQEKTIGIGLVAGCLLFFILFVYFALLKKPVVVSQQALSPQERQQILMQLNAWLKADANQGELSEVES